MTRDTGLISLRGLAAFTTGALAAVIASRVLPPLMAQAAGTAQAAAGRDPFESLANDHTMILSLLNRMESSPDNAVFDRTQLLLRLKRRLSAHAIAEEDVVYPLLHGRAHEVDDTMHLYSEHAEMKMHLFTLEQMPKNDPRWRATVTELKNLIAEHVKQEEEVDFPKLRAVLDQKETAMMSGGVQREKALLL